MDPHFTLNDYQEKMHDLAHEGVVIFKNEISPEIMRAMTEEINRVKTIILAKIQNMPRPLKNYSDIAERELGRLDISCGLTADIFKLIEAPFMEMVKIISPDIEFIPHWGSLTALGGSGPTNFHRDVYALHGPHQTLILEDYDLNLPPYYISILMPLVQITRENGPTEFVKFSHHKKAVDLSTETTYAPLLSPGDLVMFDGRVIHRGNPNKTSSERALATLTFIAKWYSDETFVSNDYLFPELRK